MVAGPKRRRNPGHQAEKIKNNPDLDAC